MDACEYVGMWVLGCVLDIFTLATTKDRFSLAGSGLLFGARHAVSHGISYAVALLAGLQILVNLVRPPACSHPLRRLPAIEMSRSRRQDKASKLIGHAKS